MTKIITKVLANRMKSVLDSVISKNQSAFIPGRLISDNVMVGYEMIHFLKRKRGGKDGHMALKIDMSKAYDRIEWDYLQAILNKMRFDVWWIQLILKCVTLVKYTFTHGSREMGPVVPSRGLRQGDPLSPYLFIICAEGLSALLRKYESQKTIQGLQVCRNAPRINHLLFADDSYLFCQATENTALKMLELLQTFEEPRASKLTYQNLQSYLEKMLLKSAERRYARFYK